MDAFDVKFPDVSNNIRDCTQLTKADKDQFFAAIDSATPTSINEMRDAAEKYFRANKLRGATFEDRDGLTRLGHLHGWSALRQDDAVMEVLNELPTDISRYKDAVKIEDWDKLKEMLEYLEDVPLMYVVWGFTGNGNIPFEGVNLSDLPCRLALDPIEPDAYFPFEIQVPDNAEVKEATAFDAELNECWRPGGRTIPLPRCADKSGFREAVMPGAGMTGSWVTFRQANPPRF